jgi:Cu2+-exporting ATPase
MLMVNAFIAGGVAFAGLRTITRLRPRRTATWLAEPARPAQPPSAPAPDDAGYFQIQRRDQRYFTLSSVSLGMSLSGALFYPPLGPASVPFTVYASIPFFEQAYEALFRERRLGSALLRSTVVVGALATQHYVLASVFNWLHYYFSVLAHRVREWNELVLVELEKSYQQFAAQVYGAQPRSVWVMAHGVSVEIPFEDLNLGDILVAGEGDVIPVEGTVVEGAAVVNWYRASGAGRPEEKQAGDRVYASSVVVAGRIHIEVERI